MIKWSEKYILGLDFVDEQHKEWFRIANDAYDLLKNEFYTDKYDRVAHLINDLKDYSAFHFESEEKYLLEIGYKKFFSHKLIHNEFIEKVNSIDMEKMDESQDEYLLSILEFILKWIQEHILKMDSQYINI